MSQTAFAVWYDDGNKCYVYATVYFDRDFSAPKVRRSLIDHDGYPECIVVYKKRKDGTMPNHTQRNNR